MRTWDVTLGTWNLTYFLTDHLGSIVSVLDDSGAVMSEQRYLPFGQVREDIGTISQTDFGYTFQRNLPDTGLMDYKARFYSPYITQFSQPDSIIPDPSNPQSLNRYAYALNNPVRYTDPTGHWVDPGCGSGEGCELPKPTPPVGNGNGGSGNGPSAGAACQGSYQSILCLPPQTPQPTLPILPFKPINPENSSQEIWITPDLMQRIGDKFLLWFEIFSQVAENGKYPYRFARSLSINPAQETVAGVLLQIIADSNNQLTIGQRAVRAGWAGIQYVSTDLVTAPFIYAHTIGGGLAGSMVDGPFLPFGEAGGAVTGYITSAVLYNYVADTAFDKLFTPFVYERLDLYDPNGN